MRNFTDIKKFYPDYLECENYSIFKKNLEEEDLIHWKGNVGELYKDKVQIGKEYIFLYHKGLQKTMMSDHESETITNQKFIDSAKGDVLIFGLGLGLIVFPLMKEKEINRIVIVELDNGLIEMVSPMIKFFGDPNKIEIFQGNCFSWRTEEKFDTIYFDIWEVIDEKSFGEMEYLESKYRKNLKEGGWMDSWCSELEGKK